MDYRVSSYIDSLSKMVPTNEAEGGLVFICDSNVPWRVWCRVKVKRVDIGLYGEVQRGEKRRAFLKLAIMDIDCGESD